MPLWAALPGAPRSRVACAGIVGAAGVCGAGGLCGAGGFGGGGSLAALLRAVGRFAGTPLTLPLHANLRAIPGVSRSGRYLGPSSFGRSGQFLGSSRRCRSVHFAGACRTPVAVHYTGVFGSAAHFAGASRSPGDMHYRCATGSTEHFAGASSTSGPYIVKQRQRLASAPDGITDRAASSAGEPAAPADLTSFAAVAASCHRTGMVTYSAPGGAGGSACSTGRPGISCGICSATPSRRVGSFCLCTGSKFACGVLPLRTAQIAWGVSALAHRPKSRVEFCLCASSTFAC